MSGRLARQRVLGRELLAVLNRRDSVRVEITRLTQRLDELHTEQDRIECQLSEAAGESGK